MTKQEIRKIMIDKRNHLEKSTHRSLSNDIHKRIFESNDYRKCKCVFIFVSFGAEVDTIGLINRALSEDKFVFVPKVQGKTMEFYNITSMEGLVKSNFGILEPDEAIHESYTDWINKDKATRTKYEKLMILPGLAFDSHGNRIGYGAGYYDKYLASHDKNEFNKVAVAFDFQIVNHIASEEYDIQVDKIITPTQTIKVS